MARIRSIKPGYFMHEGLADASIEARYLGIAMLTMADREGRMNDRPRTIKANVFPFDDVQIDRLIQELEQVGYIIRYSVNGQRYIVITGFTKHQMPHYKEVASDLPSLEQGQVNADSCLTQHRVNVDSILHPGGEQEGKGAGAGAVMGGSTDVEGLDLPTKTYPLSRFVDVEASPSALDEKTESAHEVPPAVRGQVQKSEVGARFDRFWAAYPKKNAKPMAMRSFASARITDDMLEVILADLAARKVSREWLKDGGQFIPMASTYLNQQRWKDEGLDPAIASAPVISDKRAASDAAIAGFLAMYETNEPPTLRTIAAQVAEVDVF